MVRQLEYKIRGVVVKCFPGAKVTRLAENIERLQTIIKQADVVIVHIGTNNIQADKASYIVERIKLLLDRIKQINHKALVGYSAMLPRPIDEFKTQRKVKGINQLLYQWCLETSKMYLKSYSPVTKHGWAVAQFFNQKDKLHLNEVGVRKWVSYLNQQISSRTIKHKVYKYRW